MTEEKKPSDHGQETKSEQHAPEDASSEAGDHSKEAIEKEAQKSSSK